MMDMLVMALACDLTAVATLQWSDTEAKHTFPWLDLSDHHHFYQHDGGFRAGGVRADLHLVLASSTCTCCSRWQAVDMGGHSLLDESVVFFGSELQDPPSHGKTNMPFLLAGGGGGLRTGRWLKYGGAAAQRPAGLDPEPVRRPPAELRRSRILHRPARQPGLSGAQVPDVQAWPMARSNRSKRMGFVSHSLTDGCRPAALLRPGR